MASEGEDNKRQCKTNVNNDQETNFINIYKSLEQILNNKHETFTNKVESLIEVWKQVCLYSISDKIPYVVQLMDWAKLHTLNIVLTGEWKIYKDVYETKLLHEVEHTESVLLKLNNIFSLRCKKLAEIIRDPWGNSILNRLLNSTEPNIGPEEIEFFSMETGYLVSMRLKKLCESQCEDLALNLVAAFMRCYRMAETQQFNLNTTEKQRWFIFDVYVALLFKYKKMPLILSTLKSLDLKDGLDLVKRFSNKRVKISKVWRHCTRIAQLATQVYVTAAIMKPISESGIILNELLEIWFLQSESDTSMDSLMVAIRRIIQAADSAVHLYIFCEAVNKKFGTKMKTFTIELYIRALTTDMNDLERQKNENDSEKATETTKRLANGFCKLADVLEEHLNVSRECALTSFSLQPTSERLKRIEELARRCGYEVLDTGQEWKCKLHPPVLPSDELCWICNVCGEYMSQPQLEMAINTNTALSEALTVEQLGLSPQLCDDLAVVLSSPRYQVLSWLLQWDDLHRLCVMYLNDPERTKNLVTELKFVDIDYSVFMTMKREPLDENELTGIERGYEHFLENDFFGEDRLSPISGEDSESQDSRPYSLGSDGAGDSFNYFLPTSNTKSDPNVLKSLRMFRPNLKRARTTQVDDKVPQKLFISSQGVGATPIPSNSGVTSSAPPTFTLPSLPNTSFTPSINNSMHINGSNYYPAIDPRNVLRHYLSGNFDYKTQEFFKSLGKMNAAVSGNRCANNYPNQNSNVNIRPQHLNQYQQQNSKNDMLATLLTTGEHVAMNQNTNTIPTPNIENKYNRKVDGIFINKPNEKSRLYVEKLILQKEKDDTPGIKIRKNKQKLTQIYRPNQRCEINEHMKCNKMRRDNKTPNVLSPFANELRLAFLEKRNSLIDSLFKNVEKPNTVSGNSSIENQEKTTERDTITITSLLSSNKDLQVTVVDNKNSNSEKNQLNTSNTDMLTISPLNDNLIKNSQKANAPVENKSLMVKSIPSNTTNMPEAIEGNRTTKTNSLSVYSRELFIESDKKLNLLTSDKIKSNGLSNNIDDRNINFIKTNFSVDSGKTNVYENKHKMNKSNRTSNFIQENKLSDITIEPTGNNNKVQEKLLNHLVKQSKNVKFMLMENKNKSLVNNSDDLQSRLTIHPINNYNISKENERKQTINNENIVFQQSDDAINKSKKITDIKETVKNKENGNIKFGKNEGIIDNTKKELTCNKSADSIKQKYENNSCDNIKISESIIKKATSTKKFETITTNKQKIKENETKQLTYNNFKLKEAKVVLKRLNIKDIEGKLLINKEKLNEKSSNENEQKQFGESSSVIKIKIGQQWPLQDMNPRVILNRNEVDLKLSPLKNDTITTNEKTKIVSRVIITKNDVPELKKSDKPQQSPTKVLNPCVVLKRLDFDKKDVKSVLANVPGLNDLELIRPSPVNHIVQVVQLAGGRPTSNSVTAQNTQTSTQVTPHIQRIGQPRTDKPEQTANNEPSSCVATSVTSTVTSTKPATTQPSTLINILSQQIIRPGQSNNTIRSRTSPLINILSQQIIRPASTTQPTSKTSSNTTPSDSQGNNVPRVVTTDQQQNVNQLTTAVRNSTATTLKTVVGTPSTDQNRIVQFICKSTDGKLIPVTSFTSNRVVKVATTQTITSSSPNNSPNYEENFTKFVQVTPKTKSSDTTESSETLPKFQQAFGKSVYNNVDSTDSSTGNENTDIEKKQPPPPKNSTSVNIQPIQGGVIYTRQMPVGQAFNLIPPGRGQVFRIASTNSEQISLVKDTVIHSKMSALLAAALQGKQKNSDTNETSENVTVNSEDTTNTRLTVSRPTLVQNARIVKPVLHIPSNVIRSSPQPNLSSTTLEQLREFDMVYKQVKERSSTTNTTTESATIPETTESSQRISVTYLNQGQKFTQLSPVVVVSSYCNLQPAASPALSVTSQGSSSPCVTPAPTPTLPKASSKSSKGKSVKSTTTHTSKASPIPKPQQKPQEDEHTTQRIFDILAEYAEQLRNSPDLNNKPAPRRRSNPPTNPSQNSKRKKNSSSKKTGQCSSTLTSEADLDDPRTVGSEDSSCGVVQISMQEDEQPSMTSTTSESNDVPVTSRQQLILTDGGHNQTRNLIIADSSVGEALKMPNTAVLVPGNYIMPVSMVKGGQQIAVVSGGSKILATVPARSGPNMLLFQSFLNQTRKSGVPTVKYSTIQPISGISSQSLAGVSAQPPVILPPTSHGLTAVTLGQPITLKKLEDTDNRELLLTISQSHENNCTSSDTVTQPDSSTNVINSTVDNNVDIEECTVQSDSSPDKVYNYKKTLISGPIATPVIAQATCVKEDTTDEHSAAAQTIMTLNLNTQDTSKSETGKVEERVQSVLVTACTSNGPMLSHSPPNYRKPSDTTCSCTESATKEEFLRNGGKQNNNEQKTFHATNTVFYQNKNKKVQSGAQRLDRELHQLCLQRKQAALERELRLQKSLSEECEDLGVDEPSTSDLFPEADLLFDTNHSPSFDQSSQDLVKRSNNSQDGKDENKPSMTLFSDDDNSSSLRTDFLFEPVEYQATTNELEYDHSRQLTNGQGTTSNESGSSGEDNTLLQNCASMSDVTLNSPLSPDPYAANTPPSLNKYKYKYSNRKKTDRHKAETWPAEVSSSEDTTGSTELGKSSSHSPELCTNKRTHSLSCDDELSDSSFKVVRVAISKTDYLKEDESCEELHCEEDTDCSLSGRGARRSVKKMCSCCNGSQDAAASRKRPTSGPHAPTPHKKAFLTKKR